RGPPARHLRALSRRNPAPATGVGESEKPGRKEETMARHLARAIALVVLLGALAVPVALPAAAGGGCHSPVTDRTGTTVTIQDLCFSATVLRIRPGQTVTWANRDGFSHL